MHNIPPLYCLRRGLRLKDGPGSARAATVSAWLRQGFILSPSVRTGPSGRGPAGEGRSDGGVCSTFTRGATPAATRRVADGERMNPPGESARSRQYRGDVEQQGAEHQGDGSTMRGRLAPPCPPCMAPVAPLFHPLPSYADAARSSLHQRGGIPPPESGRSRRARCVPDRTVIRGILRLVNDRSRFLLTCVRGVRPGPADDLSKQPVTRSHPYAEAGGSWRPRMRRKMRRTRLRAGRRSKRSGSRAWAPCASRCISLARYLTSSASSSGV